jgi:ABC-2 type transport system ATP-binding protein
MRKLGRKQLTLELQTPIERVPDGLNGYNLELADGGRQLIYSFDAQADETGIAGLMRRLHEAGVDFKDLHTEQSSLEDIFVSLVRAR